MDKQRVLSIHHRLFSHEKERSADACYNVDNLDNTMPPEGSQTQKLIYCIKMPIKGKSGENGLQIDGCQEYNGPGKPGSKA